VQGVCCISVVKDYYSLLKYNIRLLGMTEVRPRTYDEVRETT
jgi:hypothetical protein